MNFAKFLRNVKILLLIGNCTNYLGTLENTIIWGPSCVIQMSDGLNFKFLLF